MTCPLKKNSRRNSGVKAGGKEEEKKKSARVHMPKAYHFQHTTPFTAEDYAVLKPTRDWEQWQWRQHDMCAAAHRHNKRADEATHEAYEQKQKVLALSGQLNACRGQLEKAQALLGEKDKLIFQLQSSLCKQPMLTSPPQATSGSIMGQQGEDLTVKMAQMETEHARVLAAKEAEFDAFKLSSRQEHQRLVDNNGKLFGEKLQLQSDLKKASEKGGATAASAACADDDMNRLFQKKLTEVIDLKSKNGELQSALDAKSKECMLKTQEIVQKNMQAESLQMQVDHLTEVNEQLQMTVTAYEQGTDETAMQTIADLNARKEMLENENASLTKLLQEKDDAAKEEGPQTVVATPTSSGGTPQLKWAASHSTNLAQVKLDDLNAFPALTSLKTPSSRASTVVTGITESSLESMLSTFKTEIVQELSHMIAQKTKEPEPWDGKVPKKNRRTCPTPDPPIAEESPTVEAA